MQYSTLKGCVDVLHRLMMEALLPVSDDASFQSRAFWGGLNWMICVPRWKRRASCCSSSTTRWCQTSRLDSLDTLGDGVCPPTPPNQTKPPTPDEDTDQAPLWQIHNIDCDTLRNSSSVGLDAHRCPNSFVLTSLLRWVVDLHIGPPRCCAPSQSGQG